MAIDWKGVFPAVTTKFTDKDTLDIDLFTVNIKAQLAAGVNGIILGGTLGEASVLTNAEKEILVKETIKLVDGKVPVVINIAEGSTSVAIQCAKDAESWGAKGLMLLPPMRYKSDHRETVQYFKDIAASSPLPIMIYNNPVDYKVDVTIDMFAELAKVPSIQAVKESTRDVTNVTRMRNAFGDRFRILCGVDTLALEELLLGADGWVAGLVCAFPAETVAIYKLAKAGKIAEATEIYRWFMPLLELDIHAKLVQYIKFAESKTGIGSETVRRPRLVLEGEERKRIESIIDTGLKNRPTLPEFHSL
ncbi:MAG: dihydrodipicolinate synthase family protein [Chitinophagia bacterium]|jgi:4-hydroxy-tetrahydrodipicolinate synthase